MNLTTLAVLCGAGLDLLTGDPHWFCHPVRLIGLLITGLEKLLWAVYPKTKRGERAAGVCLVILTLTAVGAAAAAILHLADLADLAAWKAGIYPRPEEAVLPDAGAAPGEGLPVFHFLAEVLMTCTLLAARSLHDEAFKVMKILQEGDLAGARSAVSMIVGRDTEKLTEEGVAKAAVETVAENTSDGVVAPLFFLALGGPVLGWLYKAVNTMDSMVGYRNDRYRYFGTAAAKLDDAVNFLPSRMAGTAMVLCSKQAGLDRKGAWKIFLRDRRNHASPNSAQTEAAMAGALNVQLAGDAYYFGKLVKKKTIGDPVRRIAPEDIRSACRLMYFASAFIMVILVLIRIIAAEFLCR